MKCFYHRVDYDGKCSAAIIKHRYPECELIGVNHGDELDGIITSQSISPDETVFVVDFFLPIEWMKKIQERVEAGHLVWIDHHVSAIDLAKKEGFHCEGYRRTDRAACELVWSYIYPDKSLPRIVYLLGRNDVRDHTDPQVVPFEKGMSIRQKESSPENTEFWSRWFFDVAWVHNEILEMIKLGKIFLKKEKLGNAWACENSAFESNLDGHPAIVINRSGISNFTFESVWDEDKYDLMIGFSRTKDKHWKVSMRTTKDDVNIPEIAKKFDPHGGGHQKAGGFSCKELPFEV